MKKFLSLFSAALGTIALSTSLFADVSRPDTHAPAGVMGDHIHDKGEWMFSYSYMDMEMEGNLDGTRDLSTDEILLSGTGDFIVTPTDMTMRMHMIGGMYAPSDKLTLMLMTSFIEKDMNHVTAMGGAFETSSSGIGDSSITGLYSLTKAEDGSSNSHLSLGLFLPTGSIDERDVIPLSAPNTAQLPYPMQLGSGSFAIEPGYTYNSYKDSWSWGGQIKARIQLDRNSRDYSLGDQIMASLWTAKPLNDNFSVSARLQLDDKGNISGADSELDPTIVPTADPSLRAGTRVDLGLGINWITGVRDHASWRLSAEYLTPVHQELNGPQLETDSTFIFKTQYSY